MRENFLIWQGLMPRISKVRKPLVFLDIAQHNALEIFPIKRDIVTEVSKELLDDTFEELMEALVQLVQFKMRF